MTGWRISQQDLVLESSVFKIDVIAVPISDQMLLGLDVLKRYWIIPDLGENTISVKDDRIVASWWKNGSRKFAIGQATMVRRGFHRIPSNRYFFSHHVSVNKPSCWNRQRGTKVSWCQGCLWPMPDSSLLLSGMTVITETEEIQEDPESPAIRKTECDKGSQTLAQKLGSRNIWKIFWKGLVNVYDWQNALLCLNCYLISRMSSPRAIWILDLFLRFSIRSTLGHMNHSRSGCRRTPLGFQEEEEKASAGHVRRWCYSTFFMTLEFGASPSAEKGWSASLVIDFRRLNFLSRMDAFPLPRIEDCLDFLEGAQYLSTLDVASGYWQI